MKRKNPVVIGETFGKLTVIAEHPERGKSGAKRFICQCECGGESIVLGINLRSGNTKACGCGGGGNKRKPGQASWGVLYRSYRNNARHRGLCFELNPEQFKEICSKICTYCGTPPQPYNAYLKRDGARNANGIRGSTREEVITRSWICYSGIDRVNNDIGYTSQNCVPCCTTCNRGKSDMTPAEFQEWIDRLVKHQIDKKTKKEIIQRS